MTVFMDRFDIGLTDLTIAEQADPRTVLRVLVYEKRYSIFEATDNPVIAKTMDVICTSPWATFDTSKHGYPWTGVEITPEGEAFLAERYDVDVARFPLPLAADEAMRAAADAVIETAHANGEKVSAADLYNIMVKAYVTVSLDEYEHTPSVTDSDAIRAAEAFARERHEGQTYGDGSYVDNHLIPVLDLVRAAGGGELAQVAALLHDTLEDTSTTFEEIADRFGQDAAVAVRWLTDDPALTKREQKAQQAVKIERMPSIPRLVKMADKTINTQGAVEARWSRRAKLGYIRGNRAVIDAVRGENRFIEARFDNAYIDAMLTLLRVGDRVKLTDRAIERFDAEKHGRERVKTYLDFMKSPATVTDINPSFFPAVAVRWDAVVPYWDPSWVDVLDLETL